MSFFVADVCVTFFRCNKTGSYLNAVSTQIIHFLDILSVIDTTCYDHWDLCLIFLCVAFYCCDDFLYFFTVGFFSIFLQFFFMKAKVSACLRTFDHYQICSSFVFSVPVFQDYFCGFVCRYDGRNLCQTSFYQFRKLCGKSRTGNNDVCASFYCSLYVRCIFFQCNHNIVSYDSVFGNHTGFFHFTGNGTFVGCCRISVEIFFPVADLCSGNNTNSSCFRNRTCKSAKTDPNSHSPLDQWNSCDFISYFEILHCDSSPVILFVF